MTTAVRVSEKLVREAKRVAAVDNRSVTGQIEYWAKIGKCAEENPDLTYGLIKEILIGLEELAQDECSEYEFD
jgi:ParD-like antitoxin of type II bacterial toxin-antitoxin system